MKTYVTEQKIDNKLYGDRIYANNWQEAQENADILNLGTVVGILVDEIEMELMK